MQSGKAINFLNYSISKDSNSGYANDVIQKGIEHCMRKTAPNVTTQEIKDKNDTNLCKFPCHFVNLSTELRPSFSNASENLKKDGLCHYVCNLAAEDLPVESDVASGQNKYVDVVEKFMRKFHHRLYRGNVYKKPEKGINF